MERRSWKTLQWETGLAAIKHYSKSFLRSKTELGSSVQGLNKNHQHSSTDRHLLYIYMIKKHITVTMKGPNCQWDWNNLHHKRTVTKMYSAVGCVLFTQFSKHNTPAVLDVLHFASSNTVTKTQLNQWRQLFQWVRADCQRYFTLTEYNHFCHINIFWKTFSGTQSSARNTISVCGYSRCRQEMKVA